MHLSNERGYMASGIWLRTILIVRKETCCRHIGYSYRLTARVILYAPSHRQDNTYHGLCYTSHGALAGTRNSSVGYPTNPRKLALGSCRYRGANPVTVNDCATETGIYCSTETDHAIVRFPAKVSHCDFKAW